MSDTETIASVASLPQTVVTVASRAPAMVGALQADVREYVRPINARRACEQDPLIRYRGFGIPPPGNRKISVVQQRITDITAEYVFHILDDAYASFFIGSEGCILAEVVGCVPLITSFTVEKVYNLPVIVNGEDCRPPTAYVCTVKTRARDDAARQTGRFEKRLNRFFTTIYNNRPRYALVTRGRPAEALSEAQKRNKNRICAQDHVEFCWRLSEIAQMNYPE